MRLTAWCANTTESLAMLLRPGDAGANTVAGHITVLTDVLAQTPGPSVAKILIRVDGTGATHGLLEHLEAPIPPGVRSTRLVDRGRRISARG